MKKRVPSHYGKLFAIMTKVPVISVSDLPKWILVSSPSIQCDVDCWVTLIKSYSNVQLIDVIEEFRNEGSYSGVFLHYIRLERGVERNA